MYFIVYWKFLWVNSKYPWRVPPQNPHPEPQGSVAAGDPDPWVTLPTGIPTSILVEDPDSCPALDHHHHHSESNQNKICEKDTDRDKTMIVRLFICKWLISIVNSGSQGVLK